MQPQLFMSLEWWYKMPLRAQSIVCRCVTCSSHVVPLNHLAAVLFVLCCYKLKSCWYYERIFNTEQSTRFSDALSCVFLLIWLRVQRRPWHEAQRNIWKGSFSDRNILIPVSILYVISRSSEKYVVWQSQQHKTTIAYSFIATSDPFDKYIFYHEIIIQHMYIIHSSNNNHPVDVELRGGHRGLS